ncbi:MAG: hypothetical protein ACYTGS_05350 [Planctomycetota bacterium]|jgi:hypothetical protein
MTEKVTIDVTDLVQIILNVVNSAGAGSGAAAVNSAASAGTARTTSNAEQDSKSGFVAEQIDSDTNTEEAYQAHVKYWESLAALNGKRTYDLHQSMDLDDINRLRRREEVLFNLETQSLQNAIETANMCSKQALASRDQSIAHRDIAIHAQWEDKGTDDGDKK